MPPPAAMERSPEAVTFPVGPGSEGDPAEGAVGEGAAGAWSPVATEPMEPPAATALSPSAVTDKVRTDDVPPGTGLKAA